jgi:two-component system sensor histidine kinase/response regulator
MTERAAPDMIVVIDDDYAMRLSCSKILSKMGLRVEVFENGARGLEGVAELKPGLVVVDLKMPGISGLEVIARVHEIDPQIIMVVITGYATIDTAVEAMKSGAYDFLPKPFSPDELRMIINRGLDRRRLALESQRGEVERALLKRRFVTFVSHQLRTPLVAIHQYLDVLKHLDQTKDDPVRRQEWIDRCLKRTEELQNLISDWLTLARVEGGALVKERVEVDLKPIRRASWRAMRRWRRPSRFRSKRGLAGRSVVRLRRPELPECSVRQPDHECHQVQQAWGKVTVTGCLSGGEVAIAVADTGVGIPEQYRPFLFDEFFRIKGEGVKRTEGTGLGLHISKKIVSEMGGGIEVESQAGIGSTFRVRLPAWCAPAENTKMGSWNDHGRQTNPDSGRRPGLRRSRRLFPGGEPLHRFQGA